MGFTSWCGALAVLLLVTFAAGQRVNAEVFGVGGKIGIYSGPVTVRIALLATSTPTAQKTPTRTPTRTPSRTPTRTPTPKPTATPLTHYVSTIGSDSALGTLAAPWRTIQHAISKLLPGQIAIVQSGSYLERVSITASGSSSAPITIRAATALGAKMLGFSVSGSYWIIDGFDISTQRNSSDGFGVYIYRSASHDIIRNNYIHELCHEGVYMEPTVSYISLINNRIWRAEMAGAQVDGTYNVIIGNQVWETQQQPLVLGGIYSSCSTPGGADADGFRFFGQHHDFNHNYIHDIARGTKVNPDPHVDCFQTWGSSNMKVDAIAVERNFCRWPTATVDNEVAMIEGIDGPVGTVIFKNNLFANMNKGIIIGDGVGATKVWNNTFDHVLQEAVIFNSNTSSADEMINNIFFDVGAGEDSYLCANANSLIVKNNDFFMRAGAAVGGYCSDAPYLNLNPLFVSTGDSTGISADYHLQSGSLIRDTGVVLSQVTTDYDGVKRPQGAGYSMGAFEK